MISYLSVTLSGGLTLGVDGLGRHTITTRRYRDVLDDLASRGRPDGKLLPMPKRSIFH
jgi:hypothetical protein